MAEVDIVEVFAQLCNGDDCTIGDLSAFGQHQVPKSWGAVNDLLNSFVMQLNTACEIEDTETLESKSLGQLKESVVCDQYAVINAQFAKLPAVC